MNVMIELLNQAAGEDCCDQLILQNRPTRRLNSYEPLHATGRRPARRQRGVPRFPRRGRLSWTGLAFVFLAAVVLLPGAGGRGAATVWADANADPEPPSRADRAGARIDKATDGNLVDEQGERIRPADRGLDGVDLYGDPLPDGAQVRLGTVRLRHVGWGKKVQFLYDNRTFFTTGEDHYIRFWDAPSGREVRQIHLGDETGRTYDSRLSPDGKTIATLGFRYNAEVPEMEQVLRTWNAETGALQNTIRWQQRRTAECLAFTPDGLTVVTAGLDCTLRFWDLASGEELLKYEIPQFEIQAVAFSPGGDELAVAGRRGVYLWKWLADAEPAKLEGGGAMSVAFSPDGRTLITGSDSATGARLWDVEQRRLRRELEGAAKRYYPDGLAVTADGTTLAVPAGMSPQVELWELATGRSLQVLETGGSKPRSAAFSPDGQWLAAVASESEVSVWDLKTGQRIGDDFQGHGEAPDVIAFTPNGRTVLTGSVDGTLRVWDAQTGRQRHVLEHGGRMVRGVAASPDGRWIASSSLDDTVGVWELETGRRIHTLAGHGGVGGWRALAFTPDGRRLVSWGDDMFLRIWDAAPGTLLRQHAIRPSGIELSEAEDGSLKRSGGLGMRMQYDGGFSGDGRYFLLQWNQFAFLFDVETGKELRKFEPKGPVRAAALAPDGKRLVLLRTGEPVSTPLADGRVRSSASREGFLQFHDSVSGDLLGGFQLPDGGYYRKPAFSPDGRWIAVTEYDDGGVISIYDVGTGTERFRLTKFPTKPRLAAFSPNATRLASVHIDSSVLIWDLEQFRVGGEASDE